MDDFLKDGTLVDFHSMWSPWLLQLVRNFEKSSGRQVLGDAIHDLMGYDQEKKQFVPGSMLGRAPNDLFPRLFFINTFNFIPSTPNVMFSQSIIVISLSKDGENTSGFLPILKITLIFF